MYNRISLLRLNHHRLYVRHQSYHDHRLYVHHLLHVLLRYGYPRLLHLLQERLLYEYVP